ncbi:MAG: hypothetical protein ACOZAN_04765 [Patescibacteria group bacterium]
MLENDLASNQYQNSQTVDDYDNMGQNLNPQPQNGYGQISLESKPMSKSGSKAAVILALVAIVAGVGTGFGVNKLGVKTPISSNTPTPIQQVAKSGSIKVGDVFGVQDQSTFKDDAEGYLELGGSNGEGTHSLLRMGGESQTVYLTSSVTDLDKFVGMNVKVWGETFNGQKVGWLMDVGRVQVIETQGTKPVEE